MPSSSPEWTFALHPEEAQKVFEAQFPNFQCFKSLVSTLATMTSPSGCSLLVLLAKKDDNHQHQDKEKANSPVHLLAYRPVDSQTKESIYAHIEACFRQVLCPNLPRSAPITCTHDAEEDDGSDSEAEVEDEDDEVMLQHERMYEEAVQAELKVTRGKEREYNDNEIDDDDDDDNEEEEEGEEEEKEGRRKGRRRRRGGGGGGRRGRGRRGRKVTEGRWRWKMDTKDSRWKWRRWGVSAKTFLSQFPAYLKGTLGFVCFFPAPFLFGEFLASDDNSIMRVNLPISRGGHSAGPVIKVTCRRRPHIKYKGCNKENFPATIRSLPVKKPLPIKTKTATVDHPKHSTTVLGKRRSEVLEWYVGLPLPDLPLIQISFTLPSPLGGKTCLSCPPLSPRPHLISFYHVTDFDLFSPTLPLTLPPQRSHKLSSKKRKKRKQVEEDREEEDLPLADTLEDLPAKYTRSAPRLPWPLQFNPKYKFLICTICHWAFTASELLGHFRRNPASAKRHGDAYVGRQDLQDLKALVADFMDITIPELPTQPLQDQQGPITGLEVHTLGRVCVICEEEGEQWPKASKGPKSVHIHIRQSHHPSLRKGRTIGQLMRVTPTQTFSHNSAKSFYFPVCGQVTPPTVAEVPKGMDLAKRLQDRTTITPSTTGISYLSLRAAVF
ncbi:hypothetical protein K439DRAFT_1624915 [Ramaria rubella]|nr:hypothetical protein K439DRAFT_1624915 [Ramaria rubella]